VVSIAGGGYHLLVLQTDGTVVAWGLNSSGQANVPTGLSNVVAIAGGSFHSLALVGDGPPVVKFFVPDRLVAAGVGEVRFYASAVGGWPPTYQWQFNGADLPGATNSWLTLKGVQQTQAGLYSVVVSNAYGKVISPGARLTVVPANIIQPPQDQVIHLGGTATFTVEAQAAGSLGYQWRLNGASLPGETNAALVVPNVSWAQQGSRYSVVVTNDFGAVVSPEARLRIVNVAAWGNNYNTSQIYEGQATVPADFTNIVAVAGGGYHSLALRSDGTVVAWGDDHYGQTDVPTGLGNVVALAAGYGHNLALRSDGTVAAWGMNNQGQTDVPAGLTNVVAIACGLVHSLVLRADGTVLAWGSQTNVLPGLRNVTAIAAGGGQSMALRADGTMAAWGYTQYGAPNVPAGLSNVVAIACGDVHSLGERADHTVIAWGDDSAGQTNVPVGLTNVVAIASGGLASHNLALVADGTVVAWGMNDFGQTNVPPDLSNVLAIACGGGHSLAIVGDSPPKLRPLAATPFFTNGLFSVSVPTRCGRVYGLEFKDSLSDAAWRASPLMCGDGNLKTVTDPAVPGKGRFYRVRQW
jgi:alpha-tubulin suppressor-like RCC1 family protein